MRLPTLLLLCLLPMSGCDSRPRTTSVTRIVDNGQETLASKATRVDGVSTFECVASASGHCHYRIYGQRCENGAAAAAGAREAPACAQRMLHRFTLDVGRQRRVEGLPEDSRHCVVGQAGTACD